MSILSPIQSYFPPDGGNFHLIYRTAETDGREYEVKLVFEGYSPQAEFRHFYRTQDELQQVFRDFLIEYGKYQRNPGGYPWRKKFLPGHLCVTGQLTGGEWGYDVNKIKCVYRRALPTAAEIEEREELLAQLKGAQEKIGAQTQKIAALTAALIEDKDKTATDEAKIADLRKRVDSLSAQLAEAREAREAADRKVGELMGSITGHGNGTQSGGTKGEES